MLILMSKMCDKAENYHFIRMRYGLLLLDIIGSTGHQDHSDGSNSKDFAGGPVVKNLPSNIGDMGSTPGRGLRSSVPWGN